jgi:hypothetical protein
MKTELMQRKKGETKTSKLMQTMQDSSLTVQIWRACSAVMLLRGAAGAWVLMTSGAMVVAALGLLSLFSVLVMSRPAAQEVSMGVGLRKGFVLKGARPTETNAK